VGDLFTGDRSSDAGPTIATRSRFQPVGRLNVVCLLAAVLSVALAELAVLWLHQVPATSESNSESDVPAPGP